MFSEFIVHSRVPAAAFLLSAVVTTVGVVPVSVAQPMTGQIEYLIHRPSPQSTVTFRIKLSLSSNDQDGDWVGWDLTSIEIREVGNPDTVWVDSSPSVPTQDGLWWVEHADPDNPTNDEFSMPPHMQGTAENEDPSGADLNYDFEGMTYTMPDPSAQPPYEITTALDYAFRLVGETEPIGSGEDEPVEIPPDGSIGGS